MRRRWRSVIVLSVALLLALPTSTPARAERLTGEEIDSLLGSKTTFDRAEVLKLLAAVMGIADEEITRTAEEAVKEAALDLGPEVARERELAEEWRAEAERGRAEAGRFKGLSIVEAAAIALLLGAFGVREATR